MRAWVLMLAIFCAKKIIYRQLKKIAQKKEILQSLLKDVSQFGKLDRGWICSLL
jgi:hypothetical protein